MTYEEVFDQQIQNLIDKKYYQAAGISEEDFRKLINPLRNLLKGVTSELDLDNGKLPFVIVIQKELLSVAEMMQKVVRLNSNGIVKLDPLTPTDFLPIKDVSIPDSPVYLLADIDRGFSSLNVRPVDAMEQIKSDQRSPLTIEEGIAIVTQYPDFLKKNNCFSLLASRHEGDKRVPAIWINSNKNPNLGWCWNGNPHTWLGSASCKSRLF